MAAVVTVEETLELGGTTKFYRGTIALDSSYPTGGEALDATLNERFDALIALPGGTTAAGRGYSPEFDAASQKLVMHWNAAAGSVNAEVTNATDLSAITKMPFVAFGS